MMPADAFQGGIGMQPLQQHQDRTANSRGSVHPCHTMDEDASILFQALDDPTGFFTYLSSRHAPGTFASIDGTVIQVKSGSLYPAAGFLTEI